MKKIIGIVITLVFMALLAVGVYYTKNKQQNAPTAPSEPTNEYRIKDLRGKNPAYIAPNDAYKAPRGEYIYYKDFLRLARKSAVNSFRFTEEDDFDEDGSVYTSSWVSKSTGCTYDMYFKSSGDYLISFEIGTDDFDNEAAKEEYIDLCKTLTDIVEDFDALKMRDYISDLGDELVKEKYFVGNNWMFEINTSMSQSFGDDEDEDDEDEDEPDEEYKSLIPNMTSYSRSKTHNTQTLSFSYDKVNCVEFVATHLLLGDSKYFD